MHRAVVMWLLLVGCTSQAPQQIGSQPSWRRDWASAGAPAAPRPVTLAPRTPPAAAYNGPVPDAPRTLLDDAVATAIRDAAIQAGVRAPATDPRLSRACTELAEVMPDEGVLDYALIEFALQRNGIIEPSPRVLVVRAVIDTPEPLVAQLQPRIAEIVADGKAARLGVGGVRRGPDGLATVVVALQESAVSTAPIPRMVELGGTIVIDAVVDPRYRAPEVFVTRDDGTTQRLTTRPGRPGGFTAQVVCGARAGRQQIEITASDEAGSTVLANFPVWCGAPPPASLTVAPVREAPAATPEVAERLLFAKVNRDRAAAGIPALVWDDRIAAVARRYSDEMKTTRIVAHISKTTGSAADRLVAANIRTGMVLENVARAYGIDEAHDGLMNSPGHRANIMSTSATHVGLGVSFGDESSGRRELFVTQVFTRVAPKIDTRQALATVQQKLSSARNALMVAPVLGEMAQQLAAGLAAGKSPEQAAEATRTQRDGLGRIYQRVSSVITATVDLDQLDANSLLVGTNARDVGIGVSQGTHPELGEHAIWVVLVLAERR